jgi:hypothetical protein
MRLLLLFSTFTPIWAQSFQILPAPPSGTNRGVFQIMIVTPNPPRPASLQWSIRASEGVAIDVQDIKAGSSTKEAEKSLTCAPVMSKDEQIRERKWVCILAGGVRSIPDGAVAVVAFSVAQGAQAMVNVGNGLGASADGKAIAFVGAEATLRVADRPNK